jgi:Methyltransferase domain
MKNILERYPKTREALPTEYQNIYTSHYLKNREGKTVATSLSSKMEAWMHKMVAKDCIKNPDLTTLEIGAGTLNQLQYESPKIYDIIEPFHELFENSELKSKIRNSYDDISEIRGEKLYDRIITVATFEHILNLPEVVEKSYSLLKDDGVLRVAVPNEGTLLWTLGWKLTTAIEYRLKYNLDYSVLMKYEHCNTSEEIEAVLKHYFKNVKRSVFGISKSLGFYCYYECRK